MRIAHILLLLVALLALVRGPLSFGPALPLGDVVSPTKRGARAISLSALPAVSSSGVKEPGPQLPSVLVRPR